MDVTPLIGAGQQVIQSYAAGLFKISGISYDYAVIITPAKTSPWRQAPEDAANMTLENFEELFPHADEIDVVLLGTGETMNFVPPKLRQELSAKGLPIDVMDTGAACRTYNVLMAEGRRVVAVMIPSKRAV